LRIENCGQREWFCNEVPYNDLNADGSKNRAVPFLFLQS